MLSMSLVTRDSTSPCGWPSKYDHELVLDVRAHLLHRALRDVIERVRLQPREQRRAGVEQHHEREHVEQRVEVDAAPGLYAHRLVHGGEAIVALRVRTGDRLRVRERRGQLDLQQIVNAMRKARRIGHAVMIVANRVNTGTVGIPRAPQHIKRPQIGAANRKTRRTVAMHCNTGKLLQNLFRRMHVRKEFRFGQIRGSLMPVAVTGQFVSPLHNAAHQRRIAFRNPAEGKKSGFGIAAIQQCQNAVHIALYPALNRVPPVAFDVGCQRRYLEVILHVNREGVRSRRSCPQGMTSSSSQQS